MATRIRYIMQKQYPAYRLVYRRVSFSSRALIIHDFCKRIVQELSAVMEVFREDI